jgi:hypothetical protein
VGNLHEEGFAFGKERSPDFWSIVRWHTKLLNEEADHGYNGHAVGGEMNVFQRLFRRETWLD